jgi:hypothetical protein
LIPIRNGGAERLSEQYLGDLPVRGGANYDEIVLASEHSLYLLRKRRTF